MLNILNNILSIFFPQVCMACTEALSSNEKILCTTCRHEIPETNFHHIQENTTARVFFGRIPIENATSLFYFHKNGIVQQLIHRLKYKNHEELSPFFGKWLGSQLLEEVNYQNIDVIVPVPLHPRRQRKRGFNQISGFGKEIAKTLNASYDEDSLYRKHFTKKIAFKKRLDRWESLQDIFQLKNKEKLEGKHILLVDDVVTTGATLESCSNTLLQIPNVKISIATIAITV